MFGRKSGRDAKKDMRVWLLGRDHPGADRSINWDGRFGNLSDPDVLIVDLTGLTVDVLQRIDRQNMNEARKSIKDKFMHGGTIVVITRPVISPPSSPTLTSRPSGMHGMAAVQFHTYSNYYVLPISIATRTVQAGSVIRAGDGHCFKGYIDAVKGYDFLIHKVAPETSLDQTGAPPAPLHQMLNWDITDNSRNTLGLALAPAGADRHGPPPGDPCSGLLMLLPPPTEPIDDAIGRILSVYKPPPPAGAPPAWAERLSLGPAGRNRERIKDLEGRRAEMQGEIDELARQNGRILAHRRLLYSDGAELEDAVVEAFRVLGFDDIERMGSRDEEDAAFAMGGTRYSRCAIEAKGAGKGTKMNHILQCSMWAEQRAAAENSPVKGVFVPNQHRHKPYPDSQVIRTRIEDNQLEHAERKDICIIPSCALYEAVGRVLGGEAPDRARTAARIADSKGVLTDVL